MSMSICRALLITLLFTTSPVSATGTQSVQLGELHSRGLTSEQAKKILIFTLKHEGYKLSRAGVFFDGPLVSENGSPYIPGYYNFGLGYNDPDAGAVDSWGLFAVNVSSGEVWETNKCKRYSFPALHRIQRRVRAKTQITEAEERIQRRGTGCTER
jgi:hypothetical protein